MFLFNENSFVIFEPAFLFKMKGKRITLIVLFGFKLLLLQGQHNFIPLHSFYKDQIFANKLVKPYNGGSFFPVTEKDYNLIPAVNDSSKQYYDFTETLFKKHLFEITGKDYSISISPAVDISRGKDLNDTNERKLFLNSRGIYVEGDLFSNFSFSTAFFENQGRFTEYESAYYNSIGEQYYINDTTYQTQNAMIPGAARTKPFKTDGFDYAYAVGSFVFKLHKSLSIAAGNNTHFIGDGYRSLLLSDNAGGSPYFRINWNPGKKLSCNYYRTRYMNLLRKPISSSAETYYEAKGFSVNYVTYRPTEKLAFSLFEGIIWNRGDAATSRFSHPMYFNPIPVLSGLVVNDSNDMNVYYGLNAGYQVFNNHRFYGQFAIQEFKVEKSAFQIGYRGYGFFNLRDIMIQIEYNNVPKGFYATGNRRLNYSHFNLPVGHIKGNGFQEFVFRGNIEIKRVYADVKSIIYILKDYRSTELLAFNNNAQKFSGNVTIQTLEVGYRFNRKMNLCLFGSLTYRSTSEKNDQPTSFVSIGLKTALMHHYSDF